LVTSRQPGAWKAGDPDRRRSGGFGLSAKGERNAGIASPIVRVGWVSRPAAPPLAGELNVTGLKHANVGELFARLGFRQEAADCETYFIGFEVVRRCRTVRQRSIRFGRHDDSPSATTKNRHTPIRSAILISKKSLPARYCAFCREMARLTRLKVPRGVAAVGTPRNGPGSPNFATCEICSPGVGAPVSLPAGLAGDRRTEYGRHRRWYATAYRQSL
jgi:hypothetical protein